MSYLHESFLIYKCKFKFLEIMVPGDREGPQQGKPYSLMFILKKKSSPEPAGQLQSNLVQTYLA
jgi:hypothetical protein